MPTDEVLELQKELRALFLDKLNVLEQGQKELQSDVTDIKVNFVKQIEIDELKKKVDDLRYFKAKTIGGFFGAQLVILGILKLLSLSGHGVL